MLGSGCGRGIDRGDVISESIFESVQAAAITSLLALARDRATSERFHLQISELVRSMRYVLERD